MNDEIEKSTGTAPEIPQAAPIPDPAPIPEPTPLTPSAEPSTQSDATAADQPSMQPEAPDAQYPNPFAPPVQPTVQAPNPPVPPTQPYPYQPQQPVYYGQPYQPAQYAPPTQPYGVPYGQVPPQPPVPPYTSGGYVPAGQNPPAKSSGKAGRILMWIAAALIEAVIVGFAIYGVVALCRGTGNAAVPERPSYSQGENNRPGQQNPNDGTSSGSTAQNNSKVQMGITCFELPDQYVQAYDIEKGLVVKSFSVNSPAKNTDLQVGDVITHFNGVRVTSFQELFDEMESLDAGDEVTLTCYRMNASGDGTFEAGDPFEVTFRVQARQDETSSTYPGA